jgi:TPR repeat protein
MYGCILCEGFGVEKDESSGFDWLMKAAKGEVAVAEYEVGFRLWQGIGVGRDKRSGIRWLRKAGEHGCARAMIFLGTIFLDEHPEQGVAWLRKAAESNNEVGM